MAAAISLQPAHHRPSMDRSSSFDSTRVTSGGAHVSAGTSRMMYERPNSAMGRPALSPNGYGSQHHSRTSSASSSASPYGQPYPSPSYYNGGGFVHAQNPGNPFGRPPPHGQWSSQLDGGNWASSAIPASAFYQGPMMGNNGFTPNFGMGGQVFHQGFQQSQADFSGWQEAYQQMLFAQHQQQQQHHPSPYAKHSPHSHTPHLPLPPPIAAESEPRRRTNSGPAHVQTANGSYSGHPGQQVTHRQSFDDGRNRVATVQPRSVSDTRYNQQSSVQPQQPQPAASFHPYKRGPARKGSKEELKSGLPRSRSQPALASVASLPAVSTVSAQGVQHVQDSQSKQDLPAGPASSLTRPPPANSTDPATLIAPADEVARQRTVSSESKESSTSTLTPTRAQSADRARSSSTSPATVAALTSSVPPPKSSLPPRAATPLYPGAITNATNTPQARSSPLSASIATPDATEKKGGLKGRLAKALNKDKAARESKGSTAPSVVAASKPSPAPTPSTTPSRQAPAASASNHHPSPSDASTRSGTPPITPPSSNGHQHDMAPPHRPFAMPIHHQAMTSDISLAETERTQTADGNTLGGEKKGKRGLFRMRNMSTDNISLSSTVSSASMMIRKMGSIGKLARRNSLMGISKIFKDKPKDEDGPLPEREGDVKESKKDKKERKKREKAAAKGQIVPAQLSRTSAEAESDDRVIGGLTPAAQLARQHTLRSKAEAEAKASASNRLDEGEMGHQPTGEPTWDGNTFNRSPASHYAQSDYAGPSNGAPNVLHVQPRAQGMNVHHAHAVDIGAEEYDSDNSSDNETMEDRTFRAGTPGGSGSGGGYGGYNRNSRYSQHSTEESRDLAFRQTWGNALIDRNAVPKKGILKRRSTPELDNEPSRNRSNSTADAPLAQLSFGLTALSLTGDPNSLDGLSPPVDPSGEGKEHLNFSFDSPADIASPTPNPFSTSPYAHPGANTSAPVLSLAHHAARGGGMRSMTAPAQRRGIAWAPECAVYSTYDAGTYDRRSEPATCNNLTPELALSIKQELNAFKLEMPVHPQSAKHTHYFN